MILTDGTHLVSDESMQEIHRFARYIGLQRKWFQNRNFPHYKLKSLRMRNRALRAGAKFVTPVELIQRVNRK